MEILQLVVTSLGPLSLTLFFLFVYFVNRPGFTVLHSSKSANTQFNALPVAAE